MSRLIAVYAVLLNEGPLFSKAGVTACVFIFCFNEFTFNPLKTKCVPNNI
jgi:hypothetical protein